jgi:biofilm PGA synthesis N-glycosyltransferase PgaC
VTSAGSSHPIRYALVTPARNEATNLGRLAACVTAQTVLPATWVIVDDGSDDATPEIAGSLAEKHDWITLLRRSDADTGDVLRQGRRQGRDVKAFTAGLEALADTPDVAVKLDADVSFEDDFFERLLAEFDRRPALGIAGGICYELDGGLWVARHTTKGHVRGATRAYRRACFEAVQPLEPKIGWDGIDELKARALGWETGTIPDLPFRHYRPVGQRDGLRRAFVTQGEAAHYMGYRPTYLVLRSLYQARREPLAIAMIWGYLVAVAGRRSRCADPLVRQDLRDQQRWRSLSVRAHEAAGR